MKKIVMLMILGCSISSFATKQPLVDPTFPGLSDTFKEYWKKPYEDRLLYDLSVLANSEELKNYLKTNDLELLYISPHTLITCAGGAQVFRIVTKRSDGKYCYKPATIGDCESTKRVPNAFTSEQNPNWCATEDSELGKILKRLFN
ncbi:MAG: hypothetical protein ACXWRU_20415 [Pseudobdellovibrionaceae bacterium]